SLFQPDPSFESIVRTKKWLDGEYKKRPLAARAPLPQPPAGVLTQCSYICLHQPDQKGSGPLQEADNQWANTLKKRRRNRLAFGSGFRPRTLTRVILLKRERKLNILNPAMTMAQKNRAPWPSDWSITRSAPVTTQNREDGKF